MSRREHGSVAMYVAGCRCPSCRDASREYNVDRRIKALRSGFAGYNHGEVPTYSVGCRCSRCRMGKSDYGKARRARLKAAESDG